MTRIGFYAGSFDPLTLGHLDVIRAATRFCDRLVVGVGVHPTKVPLLDLEQRTALIEAEAGDLAAASACELLVQSFSGLTVDAARACGAGLVVRGLRSASDFDNEIIMAGMNGAMAPELQTVFVPASPGTRHVTATLVRQIAALGGDIDPFVPPLVSAALKKRFATR